VAQNAEDLLFSLWTAFVRFSYVGRYGCYLSGLLGCLPGYPHPDRFPDHFIHPVRGQWCCLWEGRRVEWKYKDSFASASSMSKHDVVAPEIPTSDQFL